MWGGRGGVVGGEGKQKKNLNFLWAMFKTQIHADRQ